MTSPPLWKRCTALSNPDISLSPLSKLEGHEHAEAVDAPAHPKVWVIMVEIYEYDYHYSQNNVRVNRKIHFFEFYLEQHE